MNKNFLSNLFQTAHKPPPTSGFTSRRESKVSTHAPQEPFLQLEEPQRDYTLYLQLPSNHYKFMVELDATLQSKCDLLLQSMDRYAMTSDYPSLSLMKGPQWLPDLVSELKSTAREIRQTLALLGEKSTEIEILREENRQLVQSLLSKEHLIQSVEESYQARFREIKEQSDEERANLVQQVAQMRDRIQSLEQQLDSQEVAHHQQKEYIEICEREKAVLAFELNQAKQTQIDLRQELDIFKDTRTGSLIINNIYEKVVGPPKTKEPPLYYLFTGKFRNQFLRFFAPDDLLQLMLTSRKFYFLVRNNRMLIQHVVTCRTHTLFRNLKDARAEADYFTEVADRIPEEVLQQGIAKFLAFRFVAGSYLNDIFKDIWEFLDGNPQQAIEQQQQNFAEMFAKDEVETTDLIGLEDVVERRPSEVVPIQVPQQQQAPVAQSGGGIFSKIKSLAGSVTPVKQVPPPQQQQSGISLAQLSQQLQNELQGVGQVCANALSIPFLRIQLQQTRQDTTELKMRVKEINTQLFNLGQRCTVQSSKMSIQDFLKRLQFNFARLLAHAHYLRLECQQLQHTTHYLAQQVLKLNKQNTQTNTKLEDIVEESKTLRAMNVFMQGRMKQLEERVHKGEEDVLAFSQQNIELNQHVKELEKELIDIKAHSKEREQKLKIVAVSLKTTTQEKQTLQRTLLGISQNFGALRNLLEQV